MVLAGSRQLEKIGQTAGPIEESAADESYDSFLRIISQGSEDALRIGHKFVSS